MSKKKFPYPIELREQFATAALPACLEASFKAAARRAENNELETVGVTLDRATWWAVEAADHLAKQLYDLDKV